MLLLDNKEYFEQTTQDASKYQIKWNNVHTKKLPTEIGSFSIFNLYIVYIFS